MWPDQRFSVEWWCYYCHAMAWESDLVNPGGATIWASCEHGRLPDALESRSNPLLRETDDIPNRD